MNPNERKELRSIITPALLANNQTGLTALELNMEIMSLYGKSVQLPPGIENLEDLIRREFADEFSLTTRNDGKRVFKLIPKADTKDLLDLVQMQRKSTSKRRGRGRGRSVMTRPVTQANYHDFRLGIAGGTHPPSFFGSPSGSFSYTKTPVRSSSSMGNVSLMRTHSNPPAAKPATPTTPTPAGNPVLIQRFNSALEKMKNLKAQAKDSVEFCTRLNGLIVYRNCFPTTIYDLLTAVERSVVETEKLSKKPGSPHSGVDERDSGIDSPTFDESIVSVLPNSHMPQPGGFLRKVSIVDLFTLRRFLVQVVTPQGRNRLLPCKFHDADIVDEQGAIALLEEHMRKSSNMFDITVKGYSKNICEIDMAPAIAGDQKHLRYDSILKELIEHGYVRSCISPSALQSPAPMTPGIVRVDEISDTFTAIVTNVHNCNKISADLNGAKLRLEMTDFEAYTDCKEALEILKEVLIGKEVHFETIEKIRFSTTSAMVSIDRKMRREICDTIVSKLLRNFKFQRAVEMCTNIIQTSVTNEGQFRLFARPVCRPVQKILEKVESLIAESIANDKLPEFSSLHPGDELAGRFRGFYYRCEVLKVLDNQKLKVFFYDYGNEEEITKDDLSVLPENLTKEILPPQVIECRLTGVKGTWRSGAAASLDAEGIFDYPVDIRIDHIIDTIPYITLWRLETYDKRKEQTLNEHVKMRVDLVNHNTVIPSTASKVVKFDDTNFDDDEDWTTGPDAWSSSVPNSATKPSKFDDFAVSLSEFSFPKEFKAIPLEFIDPATFRCRFLGKEQAFNEMKLSLALMDKMPGSNGLVRLDNCDIKVNNMCLIFHENQHHRAEIKLVGNHSCKVFLIDNGKEENVCKEFMFKLPKRLASQPPFGFTFTVIGVPTQTQFYHKTNLINFFDQFCHFEKTIHVNFSRWPYSFFHSFFSFSSVG